MRTPLNTKYKTSIVYFIIHVSMPLQFKFYRLKFVIKSLATSIYLSCKYATEEYMKQFTV